MKCMTISSSIFLVFYHLGELTLNVKDGPDCSLLKKMTRSIYHFDSGPLFQCHIQHYMIFVIEMNGYGMLYVEKHQNIERNQEVIDFISFYKQCGEVWKYNSPTCIYVTCSFYYYSRQKIDDLCGVSYNQLHSS